RSRMSRSWPVSLRSGWATSRPATRDSTSSRTGTGRPVSSSSRARVSEATGGAGAAGAGVVVDDEHAVSGAPDVDLHVLGAGAQGVLVGGPGGGGGLFAAAAVGGDGGAWLHGVRRL